MPTDIADETLADRVRYRTRYFDHPDEVIAKILAKTIVPYQVELQPGRLSGKNICWMTCSYCYGLSAKNVSDRLTPERYLALIEEIANGPHGRVDKVILAGYATDPLNYEYIDDLAAAALAQNMVVGVHSKLLKISPRLIAAMTAAGNRPTNYITISVDAGDSASYNRTHGLQGKADAYQRVLDNIDALVKSRKSTGANLDIATNYLLTKVNSDSQTVEQGIANLIARGVDSIRFSFPQKPRGSDPDAPSIIPGRAEIDEIVGRVSDIVRKFEGSPTKVMLVDYDAEKQITEQRSFPCFARFIYPAVSFDGYLSHCSQSAAPHFRDMALGNLQVRPFWDAFYDYDPNDLWDMLDRQHEKMTANGCRCDRKEHTVNQMFRSVSRDDPSAAAPQP